jgi:hypothetical protein
VCRRFGISRPTLRPPRAAGAVNDANAGERTRLRPVPSRLRERVASTRRGSAATRARSWSPVHCCRHCAARLPNSVSLRRRVLAFLACVQSDTMCAIRYHQSCLDRCLILLPLSEPEALVWLTRKSNKIFTDQRTRLCRSHRRDLREGTTATCAPRLHVVQTILYRRSVWCQACNPILTRPRPQSLHCAAAQAALARRVALRTQPKPEIQGAGAARREPGLKTLMGRAKLNSCVRLAESLPFGRMNAHGSFL